MRACYSNSLVLHVNVGLHLVQDRTELDTPEDRAVREAGAADDDGKGDLIVWRISYKDPSGIVLMDEERLGVFSSHSSYILLYG
jgi:hypothetical protein